MTARTMGLACVAAVLAAAGVCAAAGETELPIRKITAFSSGVSYYEHAGEITGEAEVLLKFKVDQINDILKSLVVMGGNASGVSYASRDPVSRALKSFGVDISESPTLGQLLQQVRGAEVVVSAQEQIKGKILGVETKTEQIVKSGTVIHREFLNVLTPDGIRSVAMESISGIKLADEKLSAELDKALALMVESRDSNRKPVTVRFTGEGKREVRLGYIAEAPVWKTSYRLVIGEQDVRLHGWAIVENTSDFDWSEVDLTLVSGRPISFVQDLYTPLYVPRPVVQPELYASLRPQRYEEGIEREKEARDLAEAKYDRARRAAPPAAAAPAEKAAAGYGRGLLRDAEAGESLKKVQEALQQGVQSVATAAQVGELSSYRIAKPVTLQRRKSAMLPIVNQAVKGAKVSIYNASVLAAHPLSGVWLTNDTGLSLLAGPVTVFEAGTYAGDAQIDNLSPNDKRLLSYAIDLKVKVDSADKSANQIVSVKIVRGVLQLKRRFTYTRTYTIKNKAEKQRTVLIEHPRRSDLKLVTPEEPKEKAAGVYRLEVEVPAGKTVDYPVVEERVGPEMIAILHESTATLQAYISGKEISEGVRKALREAVARKDALAQAQREVSDLTGKIGQLTRDQVRLQGNMRVLDKDSPGYKSFATKLVKIEEDIEKLQKSLDAAEAARKAAQQRLEDYLRTLDVE